MKNNPYERLVDKLDNDIKNFVLEQLHPIEQIGQHITTAAPHQRREFCKPLTLDDLKSELDKFEALKKDPNYAREWDNFMHGRNEWPLFSE